MESVTELAILDQARNAGLVEDQTKVVEFFNTRLIDFDLVVSSGPNKVVFDEFIDNLTAELEEYEQRSGERKYRRRGRERAKFQQCVYAIVLNLVHNQSLFSSCSILLSISLNKNDYGIEFPSISYRAFKSAYDALLALGYVEVVMSGFNLKCYSKGKRTAIKHTDLLLSYITDHLEDDIPVRQELDSSSGSIVLKDENKKIVKVDCDNSFVGQMHSQMGRVNSILSQSRISLSLSDDTECQLRDTLSRNEDTEVYKKCFLDFRSVALKRVFNNGSYKQGGRLYGGWWQNVPKLFRPFIQINGNSTVELDYSEMHPTMVYEQEGVNMPANPYQPNDAIDRKFGKVAFNALLNANRVYPRKDHAYKRAGYSTGWRAFLDEVIDKHKQVSHRFLKGDGIHLQYLDSQIAMEVLLSLEEQGICCLPIHDSFIVEAQHKETLRSVMSEASRKVVGIDFVIK